MEGHTQSTMSDMRRSWPSAAAAVGSRPSNLDGLLLSRRLLLSRLHRTSQDSYITLRHVTPEAAWRQPGAWRRGVRRKIRRHHRRACRGRTGPRRAVAGGLPRRGTERASHRSTVIIIRTTSTESCGQHQPTDDDARLEMCSIPPSKIPPDCK